MRSDDSRADNLFLRLFSYTPREGRTPLEDFCTEGLAWCLRRSPQFRERFFNLLDFRIQPEDLFEIDTQLSFRPVEEEEEEDSDNIGNDSGGRFDMAALSITKNYAFVFEVKVAARFVK